MNMREMFVDTTNSLIESNPKVSLVLGGISVASFSNSIKKYPERVFDAGIMEQGGISVCAGLAISGMIPFYHTIAPFMAERAYEQLKIDFGYQKIGGNFVSNGASVDYSSFGATHQCPAEIGILKHIPGMQILVPGTAEELRMLLLQTYDNGCPTYTRLSRDVNKSSQDVFFGRAIVIKKGNMATIIAIGPMLQIVLDATEELDVTILYYSTVAPFDKQTLSINLSGNHLFVCEPCYEGSVDTDIIDAIDSPVKIHHVGIPHEFCRHYGTTKENYMAWGLTGERICYEINKVLNNND